jgi:hypothetical protein
MNENEQDSPAVAAMRKVLREEFQRAFDAVFEDVPSLIGEWVSRRVVLDLKERLAGAEAKTLAVAPLADAGLVARVLAWCEGAKKPGQAQGVTYVARQLGVPPNEVHAAFLALESAGKLYARPHVKGSKLWYVAGQGPGPVKGGAK